MKNYWDGLSDTQKSSDLDEKVYEAVDLDKPDWGYVRSLLPEVQKKIREDWEEKNPHKEATVDPETYIQEKVASAKDMIKKHAKKWAFSDCTLQVQWKDDWKIHWSWNPKKKRSELDGDALSAIEFLETAYEEGYFPEPIDNYHEIDEMTDKQILMDKMGLTEKQADYVLMLKEAKEHLKKIE